MNEPAGLVASLRGKSAALACTVSCTSFGQLPSAHVKQHAGGERPSSACVTLPEQPADWVLVAVTAAVLACAPAANFNSPKILLLICWDCCKRKKQLVAGRLAVIAYVHAVAAAHLLGDLPLLQLAAAVRPTLRWRKTRLCHEQSKSRGTVRSCSSHGQCGVAMQAGPSTIWAAPGGRRLLLSRESLSVVTCCCWCRRLVPLNAWSGIATSTRTEVCTAAIVKKTVDGNTSAGSRTSLFAARLATAIALRSDPPRQGVCHALCCRKIGMNAEDAAAR